MLSHKPMVERFRKSWLAQAAVAVTACVVISTIPAATAQEAPTIEVMRVEEVWSLYVREPDHLVHAPQFHTVMSPYGHLDSTYFQVTWNYWELPSFVAGGLQMQSWEGEQCTYDQAFQGQELSGYAETIVWTQVLETNGELVWLKIKDGYSSTWGYFGGETMKIHSEDHIPNLNTYRPDTSTENSWVSYGSNRVAVLALSRIRYYDADSVLLFEDNMLRPVYWDLD